MLTFVSIDRRTLCFNYVGKLNTAQFTAFFSYLIVVVLHGQSIIFLHFPIAHFCNRQKKKDLAKK